MANPSAVYCEGLGYPEESVERNGGMDADCLLPDGSRCGAWDLLSGRCGQEFTFCEMNNGTIEEGSNIGTCQFSDGSTCDEYQYFLGECSPGDNPGKTLEEVSSEKGEGEAVAADDEAYPVEDQIVEIKSFVEARDYITTYFLNQYSIEQTDPWIEQNITPEDAGTKSTIRYVSGPLTIVLSAEASAPYAPMYEIDEASYLVNGFYWEGSLSFDGTIEEITVFPPGTVLNQTQARDAILTFINEAYGINQSGNWEEISYEPTEFSTMKRVYASGDWEVEVEFEPSAPLVASYSVRVEIPSENILWEGEVSLRGEIVEISFTQ
jgi:putative hemolysin